MGRKGKYRNKRYDKALASYKLQSSNKPKVANKKENTTNLDTLREKTVKANKAKLIKAMEKSFGVVTMACKMAGLHRSTFYNYYNSDPDFRKECDDCLEVAKDFVEHAIYKNIKDGKERTIIFYASTKMKDRGYTKTVEFKPVGEQIPEYLQGKTLAELDEIEKQYEEDEPND